MKIKLDLYHPYELEAFAAFSTAVAAGKAAYDAAQPKDAFGLAGLIGGIERANGVWKTAEPAEAPDASHVEPAAPTAAPEKKTRTRKPKDAPASSVSATDTPLTDVQQSVVDGTFGVRSATTEEQAAISTGNERIGPEDSPEAVAQDEADEKAESDAARDPEKPLTLDDVRMAMGAYATAFGMDAALADGPAIYNKALGPVPEGTKNAKGDVVTEWCLSATPLDQDSLGKAVKYWSAALAENAFKREKVAA